MKLRTVSLAVALAIASMVIGCAPAAPAPAPTKAPEPTKAAAPAPASTKAAAPTAAPTKAAEPTKAAAAPTAVPAKKIDYPTKGSTITNIVVQASGGAADTGARLMAAALEKELEATIMVSNKSGANGQVGYTDLSKAKPDGYTYGTVHVPTITYTYMDESRKATYTRKDFQTVANYGAYSAGVAVKADSPFKTARDLIDAAKAKPDTVKFGTSGATANTYLNWLTFLNKEQIKFRFVHFNGAAAAMTGVLAGNVDVSSVSAATFLPTVKGGEIRLLAVLGKTEASFFPGVKSMIEQGYDLYSQTMDGICMPAGTPKEIVDTVASAMKKISQTPEWKKSTADLGIEQLFLSTEEYAAAWADAEKRAPDMLAVMPKSN